METRESARPRSGEARARRPLAERGRERPERVDESHPHTFHIPVMGIGFTIDTPLKVARYGISSVVSLVDDALMEQMRQYYCARLGEAYEPIGRDDADARARRITAYLDLLGRDVERQMQEVRSAPFASGSPITTYFELLPESSLRRAYEEMLATPDPAAKERLQVALRRRIVAGSIDVNIMTKVNRQHPSEGRSPRPQQGDALSALRGYARSSLRSSVVFSAGMNPPLYAYASTFDDFLPDGDGSFGKKIILKVSDYRSAQVQGKFLAKHALWASEFRIESGLNCGGHAFATKGVLLGDVLLNFRDRRDELVEQMYQLFVARLEEMGRAAPQTPPPTRVTVQGGIGTFPEDQLLLEHYEVDGTGWATPFLLVPEVTNVDEEHLEKLAAAVHDDVWLSDSSPFRLPFWNLRTSASEIARKRLIEAGRPGSDCPKGYCRLFNTEFTETPICEASREYQRRKLASLEREELTAEQRAAARAAVLAKSCICHDLSGAVSRKLGLDAAATPAICPGPGIADYSRTATLEELVGHIYGRWSLHGDRERPHMFIRELELYVDFLSREISRQAGRVEGTVGENGDAGPSDGDARYFREFRENLLRGLGHYRDMVDCLDGREWGAFVAALDRLEEWIGEMSAIPARAL